MKAAGKEIKGRSIWKRYMTEPHDPNKQIMDHCLIDQMMDRVEEECERECSRKSTVNDAIMKVKTVMPDGRRVYQRQTKRK